MAYHIKKTSVLGSIIGTVYYLGNNRWSEDYSKRARYGTQMDAEKVPYIFKEGWDTTVVDEG
tara:strand:+ start:225 stop:410 length:186 start_codon:yes stop_codon:yes gene_type:complete